MTSHEHMIPLASISQIRYNMDDVNNYRPISILSTVLSTEIIERHVHDHLLEYLNFHDLIYKNRSGFRKQFSTKTALAYIVNTLLFNLGKTISVI